MNDVSWRQAAEVPDQAHDDPSPTCTVTEAKRRLHCLQAASFHLRMAHDALEGVEGSDLTDLDSLIDDVQEGVRYYEPAAEKA